MKGQCSKLFVVIVVFLLLAGACATPPQPAPTPVPPTPVPPTAPPDPATPVKAWVDAINSGDVDAALALFTDDVQYNFFFQAIGKEQLRSVFDWLVGINVKDAIRDCQQPQSDRVECTFTVVDDCMAAFGGTDGLAAKATYIFGDDGKIRQVGGMGEGAGWDSYQNWILSATNWMQINRSEEYDKADYDRGRDGALQIKLCKEYAASLKSAPTATPVPPTAAPSRDLKKLAMAYQDAFNRRDLDAVLALFVDDGLNYMWIGEKTSNKTDVWYENYLKLSDWAEANRPDDWKKVRTPSVIRAGD